MDAIQVLEILDRALTAAIGVRVSVNDPERFKQQCYLLRKYEKEAGNHVYDDLAFRVSPTEVWIIKDVRRQEDGEDSGESLRGGPDPLETDSW